MKEEDYISSGVLELFVLGLLSDSEKAEVEKRAANSSEIAQEIKRIELSLENYAYAHKMTPNAHLKQSILNKLASAESSTEKESPVTQLQKKSSFPFKLVSVAATIFLLISIGFNIHQQSKLKKTKNRLENLVAEKQVFANQSEKYKTKFEKEKEKVHLFQNPTIKNITIKGSEISPNSYAIVSYNPETKKVVISGINLPEPSKEMQYQLWALVDGNPVDLGVFNTDEELVEMVNTVENPDAFAVTLEEYGGKPNPNLEQLYLIGNV